MAELIERKARHQQSSVIEIEVFALIVFVCKQKEWGNINYQIRGNILTLQVDREKTWFPAAGFWQTSVIIEKKWLGSLPE